ncbi:MAG TPA: peptidoglycan bridge formation glycyltransferase FemA/FemB family protein [Patescibacteria group bacterium]|nr:peptidoglycan bridge formation glycyltransferase FemA/FemB family protein [Patescibacteria group bacterium]
MLADLRQNNKYGEYLKKLGWELETVDGIKIHVKRVLFWKFIKIQRPTSLNVNSLIHFLEKNFKLSTVYVEPSSQIQFNELIKSGFKENNSPFLPSKTLELDLGKSEELLLKEMHHKTRYNIRKVQSEKLKVKSNNNFDKFADFWQRCALNRGMFISQKKEIVALAKSFGKDASVHFVEDDGGWMSAILRVSTKEISYYMYAASTNKGKKSYTPTLVAWDAIKSAKKEGKKIFDFEGIYDERYPLKSWKGFTRFKRSFGGNEIEYPGTLCKVII